MWKQHYRKEEVRKGGCLVHLQGVEVNDEEDVKIIDSNPHDISVTDLIDSVWSPIF